MPIFSFLRWRSLLALALQAVLIVQLLAVPAMASAHGDWMEICTAEGMVKVQLGPDGTPQDHGAPARGHDLCDLCLPAHASAPPTAPAVTGLPTEYATILPAVVAEVVLRPVASGPPIGARGPPPLS